VANHHIFRFALREKVLKKRAVYVEHLNVCAREHMFALKSACVMHTHAQLADITNFTTFHYASNTIKTYRPLLAIKVREWLCVLESAYVDIF